MKSQQIDTYAFWWSEARLVIAALALFIGGVPPIFLIAPPALNAVTVLGLKAAWIISGVAAGYLLYRWYDGGQKLFGHKDSRDIITFLVLTVSGLNLGFAGVFGRNLGMSMISNRPIFFLVAILYLYAAWHLWNHAKNHGGKIF